MRVLRHRATICRRAIWGLVSDDDENNENRVFGWATARAWKMRGQDGAYPRQVSVRVAIGRVAAFGRLEQHAPHRRRIWRS